MSAAKANARQTKLLVRIAKLARYRVGQYVALDAIQSDLKMDGDIVDAKSTGQDVSDLVYDLRSLRRRGIIKFDWIEWKQSKIDGSSTGERGGLAMTDEAMEIVREKERGWLKRAIDKQPVTALQVLIAAAQIVAASSWITVLYLWSQRIANHQK